MIISKTDFSYMIPQALADEKSIDAWFTLKNRHYSSPQGKIRGLNLGFNTRDPEAAVIRNRSVMMTDLEIDPEWIACADQVHGSRIRLVSEGGTYPSTDGLITRLPGLTLAIQVADCAAVVLWDASNKIIGAFHAGWRGAIARIIPRGVQMMVRQGAEVERMRAFISPSISLDNFEVGPEVSDQFPPSFIEGDAFAKPHVDLKGFLESQLREEGMSESRIEVREECTFDSPGDFYSYRREGVESGRMMVLIRMKR